MCRTISQIRLVCGQVGGCKLWLGGQSLLQLGHEPGRFKGRKRRGCSWQTQVVKGWKWRTIAQSGLGDHDDWVAANAASSYTDNVAHFSTQLLFERSDVGGSSLTKSQNLALWLFQSGSNHGFNQVLSPVGFSGRNVFTQTCCVSCRSKSCPNGSRFIICVNDLGIHDGE